MFYSRPKIPPLGWDLVSLPEPNPDSCKHHDGLTSDNRALDFRFSGGWITVEQGAAGVPENERPMEEVLSVPIAPFGTMNILPWQICDVLGLTVRGQKVLPPVPHRYPDFDWSGETTYWVSTHRMLDRDDARAFTKKLLAAIPDSILVQPAWENSAIRLKCRRIKFHMETDRTVMIAAGWEKSRLEGMLEAEEISNEEFESVLPYRIVFSRDDPSYEDITGYKLIKQRVEDLNLDFRTFHHLRYYLTMTYPTADPKAQWIMQQLLSIIEGHFCRGVEVVNLRTGKLIRKDLADEDDSKSYSVSLRDKCLAEPKLYFNVGAAWQPEDKVPGEETTFYGRRPLRKTVSPG